MPPEETLERIRPHLAHGAITRVGDITGLDTVGVPVAVAVRPASATITVESGKGLTWAAAMTSAAMEAVERFVAEIDPLVDERAPVREVADRLPIPADRFPMFRHASISPHRSYEWTRMHDLRTDRPSLVPADLVHLPIGRVEIRFAHPWTPSSNGLASGNHFPEAVCAALYEAVERLPTARLLAYAQAVVHEPGVPAGARHQVARRRHVVDVVEAAALLQQVVHLAIYRPDALRVAHVVDGDSADHCVESAANVLGPRLAQQVAA